MRRFLAFALTVGLSAYAVACGTPLPSFADSYGCGVKVQLEPTPGTCGVCVPAPSSWGIIHRTPAGLCGLG